MWMYLALGLCGTQEATAVLKEHQQSERGVWVQKAIQYALTVAETREGVDTLYLDVAFPAMPASLRLPAASAEEPIGEAEKSGFRTLPNLPVQAGGRTTGAVAVAGVGLAFVVGVRIAAHYGRRRAVRGPHQASSSDL
jgi:hypothetical protein